MAIPADIQQLVADRQQFVDGLVNNYIPMEVIEKISRRVVETELAIRDTFNNFEEIKKLPANKRPANFDAMQREYLRVWTAHNEFKFFCLLLPVFQRSLKGIVKAPSVSVLRANSSAVQRFLVDNAIDNTVADLLRQKIMLSGLGTPLTLPTAALVAGIIASGIVVYYAIGESSFTLRTISNNSLLKKSLELEAEGKIPKGTTGKLSEEQQKQEEEHGRKNPLEGLSSLAMWATLGLAVIYVAPKVLDLLQAKKSAMAGLGDMGISNFSFLPVAGAAAGALVYGPVGAAIGAGLAQTFVGKLAVKAGHAGAKRLTSEIDRKFNGMPRRKVRRSHR